ncbi:hypothetical protein SK128_003182 [Halocaridina rubra]|uniref:Uncharacterized protein n=1 Tax=Halocaridina rubra TaxID=373956 RepID=A0AAN8XKJ6_HALRR
MRNGGMTLAMPLQHEGGRTSSEQESFENFPLILRYELPKRTSFSSWGGKRSVFGSADGLPIALRRAYLALFQTARPKAPTTDVELKRASFSPWGGKRGDSSSSSSSLPRTSFRPWGGKRSHPSIQIDPDEINTEDLLPYLQLLQNAVLPSILHETNEDYENYWEDKQSLNEDSQNYHTGIYNRPTSRHNSFRYKREAPTARNEETLQTYQTHIPDNDSFSNQDKRTKFSAWAGKRLDIKTIREHIRRWAAKSSQVPQRRAFSAWAGKRSVPHAITETRKSSRDNEQEKRAFGAWAGKRSNIANDITHNNSKIAESLDHSVNTIPIQHLMENNMSNLSKEVLKRDANSDERQTYIAWSGIGNEDSEMLESYGDPEKRQSLRAWADKRKDEDLGKRQAFNAWAGKRQSFNAWAGKRNADFDFDKSQSFSAWAGKQDGGPAKRQAFNAWAGKRSEDSEKRQAFNAWAGKRSEDLDKRQSFRAWAGKRDEDLEKRQSFNAWAGKRDQILEKRQKFNAWAGKRSDNFNKRQSFNAWAGKRNDDPWEWKKSDDYNSQILHVLARKRSAEEINDQQLFADENNMNTPEEKRQPFTAWAGKRSEEYMHPDRRQESLSSLQNLDKQMYKVPTGKDLLPLHNWGADPSSSYGPTWEGDRTELMTKNHVIKDIVLPQL